MPLMDNLLHHGDLKIVFVWLTFCTCLRHTTMSLNIVSLGHNSFEWLGHFFWFYLTAKLEREVQKMGFVLFLFLLTCSNSPKDNFLWPTHWFPGSRSYLSIMSLTLQPGTLNPARSRASFNSVKSMNLKNDSSQKNVANPQNSLTLIQLYPER